MKHKGKKPVQAGDRRVTAGSTSATNPSSNPDVNPAGPAANLNGSARSAGGRPVAFEHSTVASTPADSAEERTDRPQRKKAPRTKKALRTDGQASPPVPIDDAGDRTNIERSPPSAENVNAGVDVVTQLRSAEPAIAGDVVTLDPSTRGVAQTEEHVVRNGEDAGSKPAPAINHVPVTDGRPLEDSADAVGVTPLLDAGGAGFELQPTVKAALPNTPPSKKKILNIYEYTDEEGNCLYEIVRFDPKKFLPRHRGADGTYVWNLEGVRRVPYRLHDFVKREGETIFVVEGEKDVETARRIGLLATCSKGGASGWEKKFAEFLWKHTVVIIPDNDDAGEVYADVVATSVDGIARDWRIVRLPNLPPKGDLTDFVQSGGTKDDIDRLVAKAFAAPRAQKLDLYEVDSHPDHPTNGKPAQPAQPSWSIRSRCFADIQKEPIEWLWKGVWIDHSLNMLIGKGGVGKTYLAAHLAAAVSKGMTLPDGGGVAPLGDVVYCTTEGLLGAHFKPRLEAAGADQKRVHTWECKESVDRSGEQVQSGISLADIALFEKKMDEMPDLRLIIFDPVIAYLSNAEANDNQEVRTLLEDIGKLAHRRRIVVLLLSHLKKGQADAIDSAIGAQAFIAVPRCVWILQKDPDSSDKTARCLSPVKMNEAPDDKGKKFRLSFDRGLDGPGHIVWDAEPDDRSANEIMSASMLKNCAAGRATHEEKSSVQSELDFFEVLDALEQPAGTWVPTIEVRRRLGWNGVKFPKVVFQLEKSERIEVRLGNKTMPNGFVQEGAREEVRRKKHGPF